MSLSSWAALAIDEDGRSTNGVFVSPLGCNVAIYKNWLYVYDEEAWREGAFNYPCIMEIRDGDLVYRDVAIEAVRGPQDGIFTIVSMSNYFGNSAELMVGCGVWAYQYPPSACGHDANKLGGASYEYDIHRGRRVSHCKQCGVEIQEEARVGVSGESIEFLADFLCRKASSRGDERLLKLAGAVRGASTFNQGGDYILKQLIQENKEVGENA